MNFEGEKGTENVEKVPKLETLGIRIKEIDLNPDLKTYPVVEYFPSGYDPLKNSDDPDSDSKSNSSVTPIAFYNDPDSDSKSNSSVTPIAFYRKKPEVRVFVNANNEETTKEDDKFKTLTNKYSSSRIVIMDEKYKALYWRGEPPKEKSKLTKINPEEIEAMRLFLTKHNIPPHDVEATSPDMAYPLNKIILEGDWKYLGDIFELVEAGLDVSRDVYPTFVCNRVHKIGAIKDEEKRKRMAGILSYITHLIKYKDTQSMDDVSSTRCHNLPSILVQRFSSLFSETENNRIQYKKQELLMHYVLVLSLFVDDFHSDLSDIAKDLQMNPILLRFHYVYLGCKFSNEKVDVATLSAPLEFRTTKRKKWRR